MVRIETRSVLAGAYRGQLRSMLTHTAMLDEEGAEIGVKCKHVEPVNLADRHASDPDARPTCQRCLRRDPRFKGSP
jgi:hypothetical protein